MNGKRILVIDDEPRIVEILDSYLTFQKFKVEKAYDAQDGLEILQKKAIDLVILDEKMPGMGGEAFLKSMKKLKMNIPVVVLTGSVNISQMHRSVRKIYKHILFKPVRLSELVELVNELLALKK